MRKVQLFCVGRLKEKFYADACAEYQKRLSRYCSLEVTEFPETGDVEKDGALLLSRLPAGAYVIALCIEGRSFSSEELAALFAHSADTGRSHLVFLIGGSDGLSPAVKERSDLRLSMSRMTFPHHLARVMVLEQVYRAFTICEGGKYHK